MVIVIVLVVLFVVLPMATLTAERGLREAGVPALILHGDSDNVISLDSSIYRHFADGDYENIVARILPGKSHDIQAVDRSDVRQLDLDVMEQIVEFIEEVRKKGPLS